MNQQTPERPGLLFRGLIWLMPKITPAHVWMYRKLRGRLVNQFTGGALVLLVTTTGRRSGQPRTVALGHLLDGDDVIVAGTNGGKPALPSWIYNLRANPRAVVELGGKRYSARAEFLEDEEWQLHWQRLVTAFPMYDQAQHFSGRKIPLVRLSREP
ncbi:MAG TPA: nitroreductase/quinone reductase family protein [Anaerolineales bacterium]|nr:nitroreductase/quinone reductase family protein [Anaerolineales bacterium]